MLLLLRHAKSDWTTGRPDHDRPLNARGRKATRTMGAFLGRCGRRPDLVLSSTAVRAAKTVERVLASAGLDGTPVRFDRELYESPPGRVFELVQQTDDAVATLMIVGHEPAWSQIASRAVGRAAIRFPTAALAAVRFPVETWAQAAPSTGELLFLVTPKLLAKLG